jgi:CRISPR/Cas system-associated protein Cas10 (large subunit of type III CRISPR-Cas system)
MERINEINEIKHGIKDLEEQIKKEDLEFLSKVEDEDGEDDRKDLYLKQNAIKKLKQKLGEARYCSLCGIPIPKDEISKEKTICVNKKKHTLKFCNKCAEEDRYLFPTLPYY